MTHALPLIRAYLLCAAVCGLMPIQAEGQAIPAVLRDGLQSEFQFTAEDFQKAEAGEGHRTGYRQFR